MSSPARMAEADRVELVYYWALNQLGTAMAQDALSLWQQVPATAQAAKSTWWLAQLLRLLFGFRSEAQDLAVAYYRLARALRTDSTVSVGGEEPGSTIRLEQLRVNFEQIVDHIDAEVSGTVPEAVNLPGDEDFDIEIEYVTNVEELINQHDDSARDEALAALDQLGIQNFINKLEDIKADSETRDADIASAHSQAGSRQASSAMRIMMNAARGLVYDLADSDERVIGWVRYSPSGDPCAFCAMLISREVMYKSVEAAIAKKRDGARRVNDENGTAASEADKYHDNCRCVAIPVYSEEQFDTSDLFALNRNLADLWDDEIESGGKDALNEWRRLLRRLGRLPATKQEPTAVPEAA